jgi:hypothetical protein
MLQNHKNNTKGEQRKIMKTFKEYTCVLKENGAVDIPEQLLKEMNAYIPDFKENGFDVMFESLRHGNIVVVRDLPVISPECQSLLVSAQSDHPHVSR